MGDLALQSRRSFLEEAEALLERGDALAALDLAGLRLERLHGDPDARIVICRVRIRQGRLDEAVEILYEAEDLLVCFSKIYKELGDGFLEKGTADSAKRYYRKFIALNPDTPAAREVAERLEGIPESQGQDDGAEEEAIRVPDDFQTVTLAELYIRQGHLQMAEKVLEAVLRREPQHEKAAASLRELRKRFGGEHPAANTTPAPALVIAELNRWLDNIDRLRNHAA